MKMKKKPLIIISGPTAVGKTESSLALAKAIGGEIISADSMQVYRQMDIGTAKIMENERQGICHYLIDVLEPEEEFHVVRFKEMAMKAMKEIYEKGKIPIVVGGTGFYIQALLYDIDFSKKEETSIREKYQAFYEEHGAALLHNELEKIDPLAAGLIHENNVKRVLRALEFYHETGTSIVIHNEEQRKKESPYNFCYFVLNMPREKLYKRIDMRIDMMIEAGLVKEVASLKERGCNSKMTSMQGLGYKEILDYLEGKTTLTDAIDILKRDTRHFAKRQLTWFRREKEIIWIEKEENGEQVNVADVMLTYVKNKMEEQ